TGEECFLPADERGKHRFRHARTGGAARQTAHTRGADRTAKHRHKHEADNQTRQPNVSVTTFRTPMLRSQTRDSDAHFTLTRHSFALSLRPSVPRDWLPHRWEKPVAPCGKTRDGRRFSTRSQGDMCDTVQFRRLKPPATRTKPARSRL